VAAREAAWLASRQARSAPRRRHAQAGREAVSGGSLAPPAPAAGWWAGVRGRAASAVGVPGRLCPSHKG